MRAAGGDYRGGALPPDVLVRVAEDPDEPPEIRAVAAYAASTSGSPQMAQRVLTVSERTGDPSLERALRKAADGELSVSDVNRSTKLRGA